MKPRMHRYDYQALHRDYVDIADVEPNLQQSSGPDSIASTISSASETTQEEYKAKYERLQDSYKRLQKNNISLEEKLLNVSEKFSADKNLISRDLATQTQKVVEAKFTIQQLNRENHQLKSDLKIALNLLQNKPNAFVNQKLQSLPLDLQYRVREYSRGQEREKNLRNGGQRISVQIPGGTSASDNDEAISAAILAKVLEQRERERSTDKKFCIDIGTQTHDWIFPDGLPPAPEKTRKNAADDAAQPGWHRSSHDSTDESAADSQEHFADSRENSADSREHSKTTSSKSQSWESDGDSDSGEGHRYAPAHVSNLLLASVIQSPPEFVKTDRDGAELKSRMERCSNSKQLQAVAASDHTTCEEKTTRETRENYNFRAKSQNSSHSKHEPVVGSAKEISHRKVYDDGNYTPGAAAAATTTRQAAGLLETTIHGTAGGSSSSSCPVKRSFTVDDFSRASSHHHHHQQQPLLSHQQYTSRHQQLEISPTASMAAIGGSGTSSRDDGSSHTVHDCYDEELTSSAFNKHHHHHLIGGYDDDLVRQQQRVTATSGRRAEAVAAIEMMGSFRAESRTSSSGQSSYTLTRSQSCSVKQTDL